MACCPTTLSHYLSQCGPIIILWWETALFCSTVWLIIYIVLLCYIFVDVGISWVPCSVMDLIYLPLFWGIDSLTLVQSYDWLSPLRWRHNECDSVSNHQPHDSIHNSQYLYCLPTYKLYDTQRKYTNNILLTYSYIYTSMTSLYYGSKGSWKSYWIYGPLVWYT